MSSVFQTQKAEKPSYGQTAAFLSGQVREDMDAFVSFFADMKLTPRWYATNSYNIKYKGRMILRFCIAKGSRSEHNAVDICFTLASPDRLDGVLSGLSGELRDFYFAHLRRCTGCNPSHGKGKRVVILGQEHYICAEPEMKLCNPTHEELEYIKRFASLRREIISAEKQRESIG